MEIIADSSNEAFISILELLNKKGELTSPRDMKTKEILSLNIEIRNPYDRLVTNKIRNMSLKYLVGEWLWYERASCRLSEISYYSKFWNKISDDMETSNSAYGARIQGKHKFIQCNQWQNAIDELIRDKNSRRAVIHISNYKDLCSTTLDQPCTIFWQFLIRNNRLHMIGAMRSNDIVLGYVYDVASFTMYQEKMILELKKKSYPNLKMGSYYHFTSSMHIYEKDFGIMKEILSNKKSNREIKMPRMKDLDQIKTLQKNEKIIRENNKNIMDELDDKFCLWCQKQLTN
jgi:thymidylate synthase